MEIGILFFLVLLLIVLAVSENVQKQERIKRQKIRHIKENQRLRRLNNFYRLQEETEYLNKPEKDCLEIRMVFY